MSELIQILQVQARLHKKQGANSLGDLFDNAVKEIDSLKERLENPQCLQELVCLEQMKEIPLIEIHRANQRLHEDLAKANERVKELEGTIQMLHNDLLRQSIFMVNTAAKLEQHTEWEATANVLRRPTREAEEALNKFAIEQKIEALDELEDGLTWFGDAGCLAVTSEYISNRMEQLLKEQ